MNIGSLFRGMMGDNKPGEAKQMELKEGQVVRGVVTSVSEDGQEAVVQIQGVKVRAQLETPLQQGETTLLQVQPPGKDGMPVLKPVTASQTPLAPSTMNELLNSFQLPDTKDNRELLTQMRAAGIALTADNVKNIQTSLAQKPATVSVGEWVQSAAVAIQRGLPVTGQSVAGLQQAIFGPPLHESLDNLQNLLRTVLPQLQGGAAALLDEPLNGSGMSQAQTSAATPPGSTNTGAGQSADTTQPSGQQAASAGTNVAAGSAAAAIVAKLQQVLQQLNNLIPPPAAGGMPATGANGQQAAATTSPAMTTEEQHATHNNAATNFAQTAQTTTSTPSSGSTTPWLGQLFKLMGAEYEQQSVRAALTLTAQNADAAKEQGTANPAGLPTNAQQQSATSAENTRLAAQPNQPTVPLAPVTPNASTVPTPAQPTPAGTASSANTPDAAATKTANSTVAAQSSTANASTPATAANLAGHAASSALQPLQVGDGRTDTLPNPAQSGAAHTAAAEDALAKAQDTLKGLLLQLSTSPDAPPVLKDAAQQLVQQLTGQQLLLNTDRTAPFAQVTMFVPFNGPDGQETASVHIQSRRGNKGELDASNCRLWFDLNMKALGHTLLDVHVTDRIVSLKVHNDLEQLGAVIESKRQEVADAIGGLGYQLLSLHVAPLPVRSTTDSLIGTAGNAGELIDQFAPSEYKGVDMKI
ncbi:hypothetical protein [Paenibacillus campi]|uniref:hypothetical protein n=1 Tax=Paenibacillus campi TaxID=3106031 RepID=UPI002B001D13|nr:hypothetical protein [Paenibacillus sp. SGZ-1009]